MTQASAGADDFGAFRRGQENSRPSPSKKVCVGPGTQTGSRVGGGALVSRVPVAARFVDMILGRVSDIEKARSGGSWRIPGSCGAGRTNARLVETLLVGPAPIGRRPATAPSVQPRLQSVKTLARHWPAVAASVRRKLAPALAMGMERRQKAGISLGVKVPPVQPVGSPPRPGSLHIVGWRARRCRCAWGKGGPDWP